MQFIANGPDIPDALLQAHEEGRVVFFCGAGISHPAGLPGFKGLVDDIYRLTGTNRQPLEDESYRSGQFDATLNLLEERLPGRRQGLAMRKALAQALKPNLKKKGATDTHAALLQLAHDRHGSLRLVTTNFDPVFKHAAKRTKQPFVGYAAPMLPIPKNSRWNGLVYLHGLIPDNADDSSLNRLVVTSGDFGLAYLTERWAARFVTELFRNYVVCFVGYSINDPVMRYMMDALAADRMLGEITPQAWALGDCEPGQEDTKTIEWQAKGVTPVLYKVPAGSHDHSALHKTLSAWAATYRDGVLGKERIVVSHALARPSASTQQDDFVGRMFWALSDKSGLPAQRFADFNPAPALDWLTEAFSDNRFRHGDLPRFDVPPYSDEDAKLQFSLIHRPAPYRLAPSMMLFAGGRDQVQWDAVMFQLARWLTRHLNDPDLIIWIAQRGGQLHDRWRWLIEDKLNQYARLAREGKTSELLEILANAPKAIPGTAMQTLWRLLLTGRIKSPWHEPDLYRWKDRLKRDGLTTTLRLELRDVLSPKVTLKKPFRFGEERDDAGEPSHVRQLLDWDLVLSADYVYSWIRDIADEHWQKALPMLLEDLQGLVRDAMDLLHELGEADNTSDRSHWDLPSISPHWQNRGFHDWVALIELLRDAWLALRDREIGRARRIAYTWFDVPYPLFKRLALYAASFDQVISPQDWVEWLVSGDAWWLWSVETHREVMRLLVLQGGNLAPPLQSRLESTILAGPPRAMFGDNRELIRWQQLVDDAVWLRLTKLSSSGLVLGEAANAQLVALSSANPEWQLTPNEREEFTSWMSGTGDPDYQERREVDIAPRKGPELVAWLKKPPPVAQPFYEATWRENCRKHLLNSLCALRQVADEGLWPVQHWREALQVWSGKDRVRRSWRYAASVVQTMPDSVMQEIAHGLTSWLDAVSKATNWNESILLDLCRRILALPFKPSSGMTRNGEPINEPVTEAINHPVGHVTQVLINLWFKRDPNDNDQLPLEFGSFFTELCNMRVDRFRHGRVLLGAHLIAFFRVDRPWTEHYLLPLFDWSSNPTEARAVWEGFLWSPRLYKPLLIAFKSQFLQTANHYGELGGHSGQFAAILTYAALEPIDGYVADDFRVAFSVLPQAGLHEAAQALSQALEGAGNQREDYWRTRVHPFWQNVWPKSHNLATSSIADSLLRMCIAAGDEFPAALTAIQDWLEPLERPHYIVHRLHESGMCSRFPTDALRLLNTVVRDQQWMPSEFGKCLESIEQAAPQLADDARYRRLREHARQSGA